MMNNLTLFTSLKALNDDNLCFFCFHNCSLYYILQLCYNYIIHNSLDINDKEIVYQKWLQTCVGKTSLMINKYRLYVMCLQILICAVMKVSLCETAAQTGM